MQSSSTFLPKMLSVMTDLPPLNGPPAPRAQRPRPMLTVMTDLSPLNGPPAPRAQRPRSMLTVMTDLSPLNGPPAPRAQRPMLAVTTDHPYVPEVVWIPRHALLQYPDRKQCIAKSN